MSTLNTLEISQDVLDSARLTVNDLKVEIAISLYAQGRLSVGKARELASRRISPHYDVDDFKEDLTTFRELGRL